MRAPVRQWDMAHITDIGCVAGRFGSSRVPCLILILMCFVERSDNAARFGRHPDNSLRIRFPFRLLKAPAGGCAPKVQPYTFRLLVRFLQASAPASKPNEFLLDDAFSGDYSCFESLLSQQSQDN